MKNPWKEMMIMAMITLLFMIGKNVNAQQQVSGVVLYAGNAAWPMPDVEVGLYNMQDSLILTTFTDDAGMYLIENVLPGQYQLLFATDEEPKGVNIEDAFVLLHYLLGLYDFSDIQKKVADVDGSGQVTWQDYYLMIVDYLLYEESFPVGDWIFQEQIIDLSARAADSETDTTWGFITGDIGSGESNGGGGRSSVSVTGSYKEFLMTETSGNISIKAENSNEIYGFNIVFQYPSTAFEILYVSGPDDNLRYVIDRQAGELEVIWLNQSGNQAVGTKAELLSMDIRLLSDNVDAEAFYLTSGVFLDANGNPMEEIKLDLPYLKSIATPDEEFISSAVYPNPFQSHFTLEVHSNRQSAATVSFFDLMGRLNAQYANIQIHKGVNKLKFNAQDFSCGHYVYVVEFNDDGIEKLNGRLFKSSE
jgi:hypothetical protein